jgi:DNA-binding response OmpR family regulator
MKPRILVVDDDEVLRRPLQRVLEANGYDVLAVATAEDALTSLVGATVHLVVTDRGLPGMDGRELIRRLRIERPALPVLLITGDPGLDLEGEVGSFGALQKPFEPEQLLALVEQGLRRVGGLFQGGATKEGAVAAAPFNSTIWEAAPRPGRPAP